jgi:hypothetical protein
MNLSYRPTPLFSTAMLVLIAITALSCFGLSGCQTLSDPNNAPIIELTTQVAVGKFIESKADRVNTAKHIVDIATQVKTVAASDQTTVVALRELANARITQLNMQPSDAILAAALINLLASELNTKVSNGLLNEADRVILSKVLDNVIMIANVYIPTHS